MRLAANLKAQERACLADAFFRCRNVQMQAADASGCSAFDIALLVVNEQDLAGFQLEALQGQPIGPWVWLQCLCTFCESTSAFRSAFRV